MCVSSLLPGPWRESIKLEMYRPFLFPSLHFRITQTNRGLLLKIFQLWKRQVHFLLGTRCSVLKMDMWPLTESLDLWATHLGLGEAGLRQSRNSWENTLKAWKIFPIHWSRWVALLHTPEHSPLPEGTRPERQFDTQERVYCTKGLESLES